MNRGRYVTYSISYFDSLGKVKGTSYNKRVLKFKNGQLDSSIIELFHRDNPNCDLIGFTKSYFNTNE